MNNKEVVVTGFGVLSPIGIDSQSFWNALIECRSGVDYLTSIHTDLARRPIGSEVPDFRPKDYIKPRKNIKVMSRDIQMGVVSSILASRNAKLGLEEGNERAVDPERIGCIFGCDLIGLELEFLKDAFRKGISNGKFDFSTWGPASLENIMPLWMLKYLPNMVASHIAIALDARGPNNTTTLDRGSSLSALMEACRIIERGGADVMLAGGAGNKINPTILARGGAYDLAPWSDNPSDDPRPFDVDRRGVVVGEGAAVFVLESKSFAQARGAKILANIRSFSEILKPTATFGIQEEAIERSISLAMERAGYSSDDLGHVNANAMGVEDDKLEARAISKVLGDVPVFAPAGHFGNLGSGAGAVELAASLMALQEGVTPPTRNCQNVDPECPVNVATAPTASRKNSFLKLSHANSGRSFAMIFDRD